MPELNKPLEPDEPWADLVIAILSVNSFAVERTYALLPQLRGAKLTDPEELAQRSAPEASNGNDSVLSGVLRVWHRRYSSALPYHAKILMQKMLFISH